MREIVPSPGEREIISQGYPKSKQLFRQSKMAASVSESMMASKTEEQSKRKSYRLHASATKRKPTKDLYE